MVDYHNSSQLTLWMFDSPEQLDQCRAQANYQAREYLFQLATKNVSSSTQPPPVYDTACGYAKRQLEEQLKSVNTDASLKTTIDYTQLGPWETPSSNNDNDTSTKKKSSVHAYLTPQEEATLVSFYVSKLPLLIGPRATLSRLRRDSKVAATACLLARRFFISNSVHLHDPKVIAVAAAFLASKVEDATVDVRHLQEGALQMQTMVQIDEILTAELALIKGIHFDLLCFHPGKAVLALTEDLRTFLKSDKGIGLVELPASRLKRHQQQQQSQSQQELLEQGSNAVMTLSGQDLKPLYDTARQVLEDVTISDLPLLYNPGQIALASLMYAQEKLLKEQSGSSELPKIDFCGYIKHRFTGDFDGDWKAYFDLLETLKGRLQALSQGMYGCMNSSSSADNSHNNAVDMAFLKSIHKKLKKVRVWGNDDNKSSSGTGSDKKKNKKRNKESISNSNDVDNNNETNNNNVENVDASSGNKKMRLE